MDQETRRKLEMGRRALAFCREQPDTNPVFMAAVARLEAQLARAEELERLEQEERKQAENAKVLRFGRRSQDDPTKPAA
jgi:hypothetical protein